MLVVVLNFPEPAELRAWDTVLGMQPILVHLDARGHTPRLPLQRFLRLREQRAEF